MEHARVRICACVSTDLATTYQSQFSDQAKDLALHPVIGYRLKDLAYANPTPELRSRCRPARSAKQHILTVECAGLDLDLLLVIGDLEGVEDKASLDVVEERPSNSLTLLAEDPVAMSQASVFSLGDRLPPSRSVMIFCHCTLRAGCCPPYYLDLERRLPVRNNPTPHGAIPVRVELMYFDHAFVNLHTSSE